MDRGTELTIVDVDINVQKGDLERGSVPYTLYLVIMDKRDKSLKSET